MAGEEGGVGQSLDGGADGSGGAGEIVLIGHDDEDCGASAAEGCAQDAMGSSER